MGALTRVAAAALACAVIAVVAILLVGRWVPAHGSPPARALTVRTSFDPPAAQFGDEVVARVVVAADRSEIDAGDVRVAAGIAPLSELAAPRVSRMTRGRFAVVTYEVAAVCIDDGCVGDKGSKRLRLERVHVDAPRRHGGTLHALATWPLLELRSRVGAADLATGRPAFRADSTYPPVTYRIAPQTLAPLLDAIAAVIAVVGIAWAAWQAAALTRRRRAVDERIDLDRALALVREAEGRPPEDRRRAVGLLAQILRTRDAPLADDAGELAWSRPKPAPADLDALAERVIREESAQ